MKRAMSELAPIPVPEPIVIRMLCTVKAMPRAPNSIAPNRETNSRSTKLKVV